MRTFELFEAGLTYRGYPCTKDCSGHQAGYNWAVAYGLDPDSCPYSTNSFWEGCISKDEPGPDVEESIMREAELRANKRENFRPDRSTLNDLKSKFLPDWEMLDHRILQAKYVAKDHRHAAKFVHWINRLSEHMDHFAEVTQDVAEVTVKTTTFDVKGLTILDFELAMRVDAFAGKHDIEQVRMSGNFGMHEEWSAKYKRSINCSNPRGFSQRAHCQGRKKNEDIAGDWEEKLMDIWAPFAAKYMAKVVKQAFNSLYPDVKLKVWAEDEGVSATTNLASTDVKADVFGQYGKKDWECNFFCGPLFNHADGRKYLELMVDDAASGSYPGVWKIIVGEWKRWASSQLKKTNADDVCFSADQDMSGGAWGKIANAVGIKFIAHDLDEGVLEGKSNA